MKMKKILIVSIIVVVIMFSFACRGFALYPSDTPWTMYRYNAAHTGATISDVPNNNNTLWTWPFSTSGITQTTTPLIVDGRVIFRVREWTFAVDETTGVELWRHQTNGWMLTDPTYADGRVFFGEAEGNGGVVCVNASTGAEIWKQDASPYFVKGSPLVHQGAVYIGVTDNNTYAFEAATGVLKWAYQTDGPVNSAPAADGDILFLGSSDGKLYALNVSGPTPISLWNFTANGAIQSTPAIDGDRVFFGSDNQMLYTLNETTGELIWTFAITDPVGVKIRNGVAIANNVVYVTSADTRKIYALNANVAPGNYTDMGISVIRKWTSELSNGLNEPVYAGGKIIVTCTGGDPAMLYALDAATGITLWNRGSNWWPAFGNAVVADGRVWFNAYWWEPGSFTLYCIGDPFPPSTAHYIVNADGQSFDVALETNATIKNFNTTALETEGKISFNVQGIGTTGMCNITIPNTMLDGEYNVTIDGEQTLFLAAPLDDGNRTSLYFTYNITAPHTIEITGTIFVPEFQPMIIAPLILALSLVIVLLKPKRIARLR
jgi:outer membrane protein assembly factor BamB